MLFLSNRQSFSRHFYLNVCKTTEFAFVNILRDFFEPQKLCCVNQKRNVMNGLLKSIFRVAAEYSNVKTWYKFLVVRMQVIAPNEIFSQEHWEPQLYLHFYKRLNFRLNLFTQKVQKFSAHYSETLGLIVLTPQLIFTNSKLTFICDLLESFKLSVI